MRRRNFLKLAAVTASTMAANGYLPLLAAGKGGKGGKGGARYGGSNNCFTEPCAIEPVNGYLDSFDPVRAGEMAGIFKARYTLVHWNSAAAKSRNSERGSLNISWNAGQLKTCEQRNNRPSNIVRTSITCTGEWSTASKWTLNSAFEGLDGLDFVETGVWDGRIMTVKAKSWTQEYSTGKVLIARWAILPLLASGRVRNNPLAFDMLDDSTLRPNQTLRYEGEIAVPVKDGNVSLQSYVQTGDAVVPTHYLVDSGGRVQLVTMSMVNWALQDLKA